MYIPSPSGTICYGLHLPFEDVQYERTLWKRRICEIRVNFSRYLVFWVSQLRKYKHSYINPLCLLHSQGTFVFSIVKHSPLKFSNTYVYPLWANILGWFIATVSLSLIPLFVLHKVMQGKGTLRQVSTIFLFLSELRKYGWNANNCAAVRDTFIE